MELVCWQEIKQDQIFINIRLSYQTLLEHLSHLKFLVLSSLMKPPKVKSRSAKSMFDNTPRNGFQYDKPQVPNSFFPPQSHSPNTQPTHTKHKIIIKMPPEINKKNHPVFFLGVDGMIGLVNLAAPTATASFCWWQHRVTMLGFFGAVLIIGLLG